MTEAMSCCYKLTKIVAYSVPNKTNYLVISKTVKNT